MKKILTILLSLLVIFATFIGCSSTSNPEPNEQKKKIEEVINKENYKKADFVELNVADYSKLVGTKVYVDGVISQLDLDGTVFAKSPNISLSQKEGDGYGKYLARGYELKDSGIEFKKGDSVIVYGFIDPEKALTGEPMIFVEKIEKN